MDFVMIDEGFHVLVDDCRTVPNGIIIRDPRIAIQVLRRLMKQIKSVSWDNDMGYSWEYEGRNLIKQFLQDCKNANIWPVIFLVTSNPIARKDMEGTLIQYGYEATQEGWIHQ